MLSTAKPKLQSDIEKILYDSLYEAYLTTYLDSTVDVEGSISSNANDEIKKAAEKFAEKASKTAASPLATAIYDFVKSIGIMASPKGTLISPGGLTPTPVTGTIIMTDFTIS